MISSNEIVTLLMLGLDPKVEEIDEKDIRYKKIIIMTTRMLMFTLEFVFDVFNNKPFNKLIEGIFILSATSII